MKIIDKFILKQLTRPFLMGMVGFIIILSIDPMVDAMKHAINNSIDSWIVLQWFIYRLPRDMIYTFPMSMLLACLLCFGTMSNNSELTAIKAGGISVYRLVYPVMGFALFASFLCLAFSEIVIPRSNKMAEKIRKENILKIKDHFVRENIFTKTGPKSLMCAQQIDLSKKTMKNIMFIHLGDDNKPKHRIVAKSAIYKKETWLFYDVTLFKFEKGGVSRFVKQYPQKKLFFHEKPEQFEEESKKPKHMSMKALRKKIYEIKQTGSESPVNFQVEYYLKTAVPFSTFIFAIIGVAMGFKPGRSGAFVGFGISLLVIFAYYVAMSFSRSYGRLGFLPPPIAGWMQNFLFLGIGLWLLSKVEH